MNVVPKLIENPTWATIVSFAPNELIELAMLALMSIGLLAAVAYGIFSAFKRNKA